MAGRTMAILARRPGGPEVLEWADVDTPDPGPGEVLVRQTAIGVNFLDTYYRSGLYPWPETPMIPGGEAAGVVEAVGEGVTSLRAGERVAYTTPYGAYRRQRVLPANRLVRVPDVVSDAVVASTMLKGLTVQYLVTSTFAVQPGHLVLVHAAAGGVGLLMGPWLKAIGAVAMERCYPSARRRKPIERSKRGKRPARPSLFDDRGMWGRPVLSSRRSHRP